MAKITKIGNEKKAWTPFVRIELSESEAAHLVMLLGAAANIYKPTSQLYDELDEMFPDKPTSGAAFDTNKYREEAKIWLKSKGEI